MKKILSTVLAALLVLSVLTGWTGQDNIVRESTIVNSSKYKTWPDTSFSNEEYQMLLSLQFDGYEDMTVSDYQNRVWSLTDTVEYRNLLESFSLSEALYGMKDSDATASFLFYILVPLTAERWQSNDFGGYTMSDFPYPADNAILEYNITLTILEAGALTVREYNAARVSAESVMQNILKGKTSEELCNEKAMLTAIKTAANSLIKELETKEIGIAVDYVFLPLSSLSSNDESDYFQDIEDQEKRYYLNGTEDDYQSLLALKTPDYQNMPLAVFNMALLEWANEDYERMERIGQDTAWDDFKVTLSSEERFFIKRTVLLSGIENAEYVQSSYTGRPEEKPVCAEYLPQKSVEINGFGAWCSLNYQFSYSVSERDTVTVGERDRQIDGTINSIQSYWEETAIESMLKMSERDIVNELKKIAASYSNGNITISIEHEDVQFECMDERHCAY